MSTSAKKALKREWQGKFDTTWLYFAYILHFVLKGHDQCQIDTWESTAITTSSHVRQVLITQVHPHGTILVQSNLISTLDLFYDVQ